MHWHYVHKIVEFDEIAQADELRAFFKDFSVEGPTTKRDFRERRKSGEVFPFGGSGGPPTGNFCIFELPRLDFLQFQHDMLKKALDELSFCVRLH